MSDLFVRGGWRDKSRHGVVLLRAVSRKTPLALRAIAPQGAPQSAPQQGDSGVQKHCVILHGWASHGSESAEIWRAARLMPQAVGWHFWDVTYDSQWTTFGDSAQAIASELQRLPYDWSNTVLIGNSMGGVIARQMVSLGFPCRALLSICSPHQGPAPWVPVPGRGPRSIARWSRALAKLNHHPLDRAARSRYHFFAITYTDALGYHPYDGIVLQSSALGESLGPVAQRHTIHLRYRTAAGFDPHWRGRFAVNLEPVVATLGSLMAQR